MGQFKITKLISKKEWRKSQNKEVFLLNSNTSFLIEKIETKDKHQKWCKKGCKKTGCSKKTRKKFRVHICFNVGNTQVSKEIESRKAFHRNIQKHFNPEKWDFYSDWFENLEEFKKKYN